MAPLDLVAMVCTRTFAERLSDKGTRRQGLSGGHDGSWCWRNSWGSTRVTVTVRQSVFLQWHKANPLPQPLQDSSYFVLGRGSQRSPWPEKI